MSDLSDDRRKALRHYVEVVMCFRRQNTAEFMDYVAEQTNDLLSVFYMKDRVEFRRGQFRSVRTPAADCAEHEGGTHGPA